MTNQPDWGDVFIYIDGPLRLDEVSVLQYIVSMRKENHFHEEIVECIYKRLFDLLPQGTDIGVAALYTRRGGIDINPIRASSFNALKEFSQILSVHSVSPKTSRQ
ncbi:NADPH-dependent 7-cyano-7-deazaguanine reductase [compost metagenome]